MEIKTLLTPLAVLVVGASTISQTYAGPADDKKTVAPPVEDLFRAGETQFDLFGNLATGDVDYHTTQTTQHYTVTHDVTTTTSSTTLQVLSSPQPPPPPPPPQVGKGPNKRATTITVVNVNGSRVAVITTTTKHTEKVTEKKSRPVVSTDYDHTDYGAGVAVNYFATKNLGASLEGDWLSGHSDIGVATVNAIYRFPFENATHTFGWAPYVYLGGGGQWDGVQAAIGQAGAGVELRFAKNWGTFVDGRYVVHDSSLNYGLFRAGLRFNF